MKIGMMELIVIFVVALLVLGPEKLPVYAKKLGEALGQFRKYSEEATKDIKESIITPLEEAQKPLREAMEPINELQKSVKDNVKEVQDSLKGIGKSKPAADMEKQNHSEGQSDTAETDAGSAAELAAGAQETADTELAAGAQETVNTEMAAGARETADTEMAAAARTPERDLAEKEETI